MTLTLFSATYLDPAQDRIVLARVTQDKHSPRVYDATLAYGSTSDSTRLDAPCYGGVFPVTKDGVGLSRAKASVRDAAKRRGLVRVVSPLNVK